MGGGGHKPGEVFQVKCVAKDGPEVTFLSNEVSISAIFHQQEDVDYYNLERNYVVTFVPVAPQHLSGETGSGSQSGT